MGAATDRWHAVDDLLQAALGLPDAQRRSFVCRTAVDKAVEREVLSLIDSIDSPDTILQSESGVLSGPLWTDFARELVGDDDGVSALGPGTAVGPYTVVREVGRGGMAVVYEAERKFGPLTQRFALKLIKRGVDTDEVVERFAFERQILASLNHPNIARLHDGGVSDDGRPYFVMEFVDGTPIVDYAREADLTVVDRLRLFVQVCSAIQYAHRNLVVHRDLKPSNILVTRDGQPKLLDFGIAKVIHPGASMQQIRTRTGSFWLTPDYASPEQVKGLGVTTTSDVYGLGVVLYELLTGRRPFVFTKRDPVELRRVITETTPDRPSTVVHRSASGERIPWWRWSLSRSGWAPDRVSRQLRGDLDTIVLKALRKEPERRYESAEALVTDIRRFLSGWPVKARPDSGVYRLGKFATRNSKSIAAIGIALVVAIGSLFYHTAQMTYQRNIAREQAVKSEQVASFISGLLGGLRPNEGGGGTIRVEEILNEGLGKVGRDLAQQPDVQAHVYHLIGEIYEEYGKYEEAVAALGRAIALSDTTEEAGRAQAARAYALLGWTLHKHGNSAAGRVHLDRALEMQQSMIGVEEDIATTMTYIGWTYQSDDAYQQAHDTFLYVLEMQRALYGDEHVRVVSTYGNIAYNHRTQGRFDEAEAFYREAERIARKLFTEHTELAGAVHGLGTLLMAKGDLDAAEPYLLEGLAMRRRLFGMEHPQVAESLSNLGMLYQDQGRFEDAERSMQEALSMSRQLFPADHITIANAMNLLGWLYFNMGDAERSEPLMVEAVRQYRVASGERHSNVAAALNKLGLIQTELGEFDRAETSFIEAINIRTELLGERNNIVEITRSNLGDMHIAAGDFTRAEAVFRDVLASRTIELEEGHFRIGQAHRDLGIVLLRQARFDEAEQHLVEGYDILRRSRGIEDEFTQNAIRRLVELYERNGAQRRAGMYRDLVVEDA